MMLRKLIDKIKYHLDKIKYHLSTEWCYDRMEADGVAAMGCCCGVAGGTRATDYPNFGARMDSGGNGLIESKEAEAAWIIWTEKSF